MSDRFQSMINIFSGMIFCSSLLACGSTSMKGSGKQEIPRVAGINPTPLASPEIPMQTVVPNPSTPTPSIAPSPAPNTTSPIQIVDGMEVFLDSNQCLARAKQLATQAGFQADVAKSLNLGFYKIEPSKGLCDIHFLANLNDQIGQHEGRDSVLINQVALYCPCNGPWPKMDTKIDGSSNSFPDSGFVN